MQNMKLDKGLLLAHSQLVILIANNIEKKRLGTNSSACLDYIRFRYLGIATNLLPRSVGTQSVNPILEVTKQIKGDKLEELEYLAEVSL